MVAVAVTSWVAIRRYGLFDARLVVRRAWSTQPRACCVAAVYAATAARSP